METITAATITTTCSGCSEEVKVAAYEATVQVPSNGKRGSLHVPAHKVVADVYDDGDLLTWDCPACGYADSYDLHQE